MGRDALGEFEQLVLLACLRLGDDAHTVAILDEIEERTGRTSSHAAVYVALRRLEEKGLVDSRMADPTPERGGKAKRHFRVRAAAMEPLREARDALMAMWAGVEEGGVEMGS